MKMKLWTYAGVALVLADAFFLGGLRAAELVQNQPAAHRLGLESFRARLIARWHKPPPEIVSPVTVRLFAAERITALWINSPSGFYVMDQKIMGRLSISLQEGKLRVYKGKRCEVEAER